MKKIWRVLCHASTPVPDPKGMVKNAEEVKQATQKARGKQKEIEEGGGDFAGPKKEKCLVRGSILRKRI